MTNMYVLVKVCIWVLGLYKLEALGGLMGFLEFCSLCLFDVIIKLHPMIEKTFNDFLIGKSKRIIYNKACLIHGLYYVYVVEVFITLILKT